MTVADIYARMDPNGMGYGDDGFFSYKAKDGTVKAGCRTQLWFMAAGNALEALQEYREWCECEVEQEYISNDEAKKLPTATV